ncbi:CaiB/BaiF CoA transferase family protein [Sphingomonas profundi]|uniref:CaiB/BaiF CoA transferase family protein n=1 Tax=Alterirhizorhabdus profundi TaxID=2681549 RepID=UPI0012E81E42|nr:CoA transferase [Sphingomonas profundi]
MSAGPLNGVTVIEVGGWFTGAMATCMMADQGADVIKIEAPGGDGFRQTGTARGGHAAMFMSANRNKRSVTLDLKQAEDLAALRALVGKADVFVQNARPGAMARLGLDADTLRGADPRLIHVSISAYGQTGPNALEGGFDTLLQALSGLCVVQGGGPAHRPQMVRTLAVDKMTSPIVAQAISSALYARERTGVGATLDYAMLDGMVWWMWPDGMTSQTFIGDGVEVAPDLAEIDFLCPTDDGFIVATPHMEPHWLAFTELIGRIDVRADPRFRTARTRQVNMGPYSELVRGAFAGRTTADWCRLLRERQIPCAPVLAPHEVADYPQVVWNGTIEEIDHPEAGRYRSARAPVRFDGVAAGTRTPPPAPGQDTEAVLREYGIRR